MAELSADAKKLLKYFKDKGFRQGDFEDPATFQALFDEPEKCEAAEAELERLGFVELGQPSVASESSRVRAAALTLDGVRFSQKNQLD